MLIEKFVNKTTATCEKKQKLLGKLYFSMEIGLFFVYNIG